MSSGHLTLVTLIGALALPSPAGAQPGPADPRDGSPAASAPEAQRALPLRLTLLDPSELSGVPTSFSCRESEDEARNVASRIQLNAATLPLTRRLTLHAFSRWGCPTSAGAAAGVTYRIELAPRLAIVLAGGVAAYPHAHDTGWLLRPALRADLTWTTKEGHVRSVGVDATQILKSAAKAGVRRRVGASVSGSF